MRAVPSGSGQELAASSGNFATRSEWPGRATRGAGVAAAASHGPGRPVRCPTYCDRDGAPDMTHSTDRILTTHVGSLVRPPELVSLLRAASTARPSTRALRRVPPPHRGRGRGAAGGDRGRRRQRRRVREVRQLVPVRPERLGGFDLRPVLAGRTRPHRRRRPAGAPTSTLRRLLRRIRGAPSASPAPPGATPRRRDGPVHYVGHTHRPRHRPPDRGVDAAAALERFPAGCGALERAPRPADDHYRSPRRSYPFRRRRRPAGGVPRRRRAGLHRCRSTTPHLASPTT